MALRPLLPFWQAQFAQVFPLKPEPFYKLSTDVDSTKESAISLLFSSSPTLALSSPQSFLLLHTPWQILSLFLYHNGSPYTRFSGRKTQLIRGVSHTRRKSARRSALLLPHAISCSFSPLISRIQFSRTGGILSHLNFLAHRFPRFPLRKLCSLFTLAASYLVFDATYTAFC